MVSEVVDRNDIFSKELKDYFKSLNVSFTLFPDKATKSYKSIEHFYNFIEKEVEFWGNCTVGKANGIRTHFNNIKNLMDSVVKYKFETHERQIIHELNQVIINLSINRYPCVFSSTAISKYIIEQYTQLPVYADAACEYLLDTQNGRKEIQSNINNKEFFTGLINAYNYNHPPTLTKSLLKNEKESFEHLREEYINSLNRLDEEYYSKLEILQSKTSEYQNQLFVWKDNLQNSTENFVNEQKTELEKLTKLYEEKLKLEAPAKYWEETSKEYEITGKRWKNWAIGISTVFIVFLTCLLFLLPSDILQLNFNSLKMTIILTVIISIGVYIINFFIRLSTSAFHLSRDAKERHKLTYVYLALLQEKGIEESDRSIVLQSLFSRADTGLLKGDSSPTLPDGLLGQAFKNLNNK